MYIVPRHCGRVAVNMCSRSADLNKLGSVRVAVSYEPFQDFKIRDVHVACLTARPKLLAQIISKRKGYVSVNGLQQPQLVKQPKSTAAARTDVTTPQLFILCPHAAVLKSRCDKSDCMSTVPAVSPKSSSKTN